MVPTGRTEGGGVGGFHRSKGSRRSPWCSQQRLLSAPSWSHAMLPYIKKTKDVSAQSSVTTAGRWREMQLKLRDAPLSTKTPGIRNQREKPKGYASKSSKIPNNFSPRERKSKEIRRSPCPAWNHYRALILKADPGATSKVVRVFRVAGWGL